MAKKRTQKRKPAKVKKKTARRHVSLLPIFPRPPKRAARSIKKPALFSVKKKTVLKKPAKIKKSRQKPDVLLNNPSLNASQAPAVKPDATFIDAEKLPEMYNSTDVTLMVKDPYWIHAYWETTPSSIQEVKKKIGVGTFKKSIYTLRIHDISAPQSKVENARTHFDIDVDPKAQNWYINLWRDNVTYFADFGVRAPKGAFYPLARSNTVTTPRAATTSEMPDAIWMRVKEKGACSIVDVTETKPLTAALRPVMGAALHDAPKRAAVLEAASLSSDSGQCSIDITGFAVPDPLEQTPASGGSSAYSW
jgi:hypothetical protein